MKRLNGDMLIALDTNILVRFLLNDSPAKTAIARKLLLGAERCESPVTVLLELIWVLESKKFQRPFISSCIRVLGGLKNFSFDNANAINSALRRYENGMGFADALHWSMSAQRATEFKTFDKAFARSALKLGELPPVTIPS